MNAYLTSSEFIDWEDPLVFAKAKELSRGVGSHKKIARNCFEFVRDKIKHSRDFSLNPVTCRASEVLLHKTGYCYAKSHLLAALLRANGIPAGLCYQRLSITDNQPPFCLHGLNAVYLPDIGWYRVDARGNKPGIEALFTPPIEKLAYPILIEGESDLPGIWAEPLAEIITVLTSCTHFQDVADNLPDIDTVTQRSNSLHLQPIKSPRELQMKNPDRKTAARLEELPNIGKAMAEDLQLIGISSPQQLIGKDAFALYDKLCTKSGQKHDPCVIDVFMSVIHFMEGGDPLPWWSYTGERKKKQERERHL